MARMEQRAVFTAVGETAMTLIKNNSAAAKRAEAFRSPSVTAARAAAEAIDARDAQVQALTEKLREMEAALRAARERNEADCTQAFERGHQEGLAAAETHERERTDVLKGAAVNALAVFEQKLDRERDLAIDIARAALDRIVTDASLYHGLVVETARRHAAALQRGSILALRVSPADFPDAASLAALPQLGPHAKIEADPSLDAGACIFDLSLGSLDASMPRQLAAIEGIFEQAYPARPIGPHPGGTRFDEPVVRSVAVARHIGRLAGIPIIGDDRSIAALPPDRAACRVQRPR